MNQTVCKGCGKSIMFGKTVDGKIVPLDPVPPVYVWSDPDRAWVREKNAFVSHFATCSKANDFSASKKQKDLL